MKTILIQKRRSAQNPFEVCMGNGQRITFTSKRNARQFMAETNRFLTKALITLNQTYIDSLREYRLIWFVTANSHKGTRTNYWDVERKIKDQLDSCEMCFNKFGQHWAGSDDPFFAFIDLRKIAAFMGEACRVMAEFHKKRNNTPGYYVCLTLADRCQAVINKLSVYPSDGSK